MAYLGSPSGWEADESQGEEERGERLHRPADGEDGAADAGAAAQGQQGEHVSQHLEKKQETDSLVAVENASMTQVPNYVV